ncbi:TPA_asm: polyprotein [Primula vulgaris waikavirus]|uniref:Polyprotein n=1 Tax=Primula vulgaris waikavirus TaxID=3027348 RepID=A0AA48SGI6_9SECO|nr:TPA_asm: polyprotein [Primula vulgaris waikavirus]
MQTNKQVTMFNGIALFKKEDCGHIFYSNRNRSLICDFCNLIHSVYYFNVKNKCKKTKTSLCTLVSENFISLWNSVLCLSTDSAVDNINSYFEQNNSTNSSDNSDVESSSSNKSSCKSACVVPDLSRNSIKNRNNYYSRNLCDHAEHIFECASVSDSTRGELFPICGASIHWYATCEHCSASCEFATPRSQMMISIFFRFCKIGFFNGKCYIAVKHSEEWSIISGNTMKLLLKVLGSEVQEDFKAEQFDEPVFNVPTSAVRLGLEFLDHYDTEPIYRFATNEDNRAKWECNHHFYLTNGCETIPLTRDMLTLFMHLIPGFGYYAGRQSDDELLDFCCGIISIGGLMGVNVMCDYKFLHFHQDFYNGPHREEMSMEDFYVETCHAISEINIEGYAESQMDSSGSEEVEREEIETLEREDDEEGDVDLDAQYEAFMNNDDPLFEIEIAPRTTTRGLKQKVGGLLRGVSNCIKKLHAVWDWPLDTAVKIVDDTGKWMEKNKEFVDENVWSCQMCEQLSKDQRKSAESVERDISLIREGIKRLAKAIDTSTGNYAESFKSLENRLSALELKIESLPRESGDGISEEKINKKFKEFRKGMVAVMAEDKVNHSKGLTELGYSLQELSNKVEKMSAGKEKPWNGFKKKEPKYGEIGEQMPIPKGKVVAQMALKEDDVVVPDEVSSEEVIGTLVKASGANDVHSAIKAKHLVSSFQWGVSSGEGNVLADIVMPNAIFSINKRMANIASYFQYFNCEGLEFEITTTSVMMQGGTLFVCWDSMSSATQQKVDSVLQLSGLPGIYVHAASSGLATFKVSSPSIQHMMCLSGSEKSLGVLGTLKICCANILNAPLDASQKVEVHVWVKFLKPVLSFYTLAHEVLMSQRMRTTNLEKQLESLEAIVARGRWTTTSSMNLSELLVHPTCSNVEGGLVTQTPLSVISHVFARWKGCLNFRIIFGASRFVKGKVMVTAIPVQFRQSKLTLEEMSAFPCLICDMSESVREFDFEVPYHSVGKNSLVCRNSLFDISNYDASLVTTRLHMIILDPLVMNANASNSLSYVVTMRPGKDFELIEPHGIHAEYVDRVVPQLEFQKSLSCSKLVGEGFNLLCSEPSLLRVFKLDNDKKNAVSFVVSPTYRSMPPCTTLLSWLAQIFVQWRGDLVYELRAHSFDKTKGCFIKIWYEPNGSTKSGNDFEFLSGIDPPSGTRVTLWDPLSGPKRFVAPFSARTEKLLIQKTRYTPSAADWLHYFNGVFYVDFEGSGDIELQLSISGGDNFEMFERTVAPRCGNVTKAFTKLSYHKKLLDVVKEPKYDREILRGPFAEAKVDPIWFKPVQGVESVDNRDDGPTLDFDETSRSLEPQEGDEDEDEEGNLLVFRKGKWRFAITKQMDCCVPLKEVRMFTSVLRERDTCNKLADMIDNAHEASERSEMKEIAKGLPEMVEVFKLMKPILKSFSEKEGSLSSQMMDVLKTKIMNILSPLIEETIPGIIASAFEHKDYVWATIVTLVGGALIFWLTPKVKSFKKKFAVLCMIIWSPYIKNKVWDLGSWIKSKWVDKLTRETPCRKHSIAGMTEGAEKLFGNFSEWFQGNWTQVVQSLLSVLGVVASLAVWGTIPDGKKLNGFSSIFKEIGEKGKTITQILNGWNSINKATKEWSEKFMSWIMSMMGNAMPSADSALQAIIDFNIKEWILEVRNLSLLENKFTDFGSEDYLIRVRRVYDKSQQIQSKLIDGCKVDLQLSMILKECKDKCTELLNESYTFKGMKQPRIDPFHICLIGAPGVGKSTLTHILINDMMDYKNEPKIDRIYTRCCADAYWSNYHQEPVILYDDLGAIKSSLKLSDYAEIMGIKTNDPFSVPMAGVNEKGRHCTSKYVFSCTNVMSLDDSGDVVTKNAYYRRRNILVDVTRDADVPRDPEDPTKGLQFTVLGYKFVGRNAEGVEFGIKNSWNESFLTGVDTREWYFEKVDYETFLNFANIYSSKYMESQNILLKSMKGSRKAKGEDERVEKQADYNTITLGNLIKQFDDVGYTGKNLCDMIIEGKESYPSGWCTRKVLTFREIVHYLCDCHEDETCNFDIVIRRLACASQVRLNKRNDLMSVHEKFGFDKVSFDSDKITLRCKIDDNINKVEALSLIVAMAQWGKMSDISNFCYYKRRKMIPRDRITLSLTDIDIDDRLRFDAAWIPTGEYNAILWSSVGKFYPQIVKQFGFVSLYTGTNYLVLLPDITGEKPTNEEVENCWNVLLSRGLEVNLDPIFLVKPTSQFYVRQLLREVEDWDLANQNYKSLKDVMGKAEKCFGAKNGMYVTFGLILVEESIKHFSKHVELKESERMAAAFVESCKNYEIYEGKLIPQVSKKIKIALAIAGGIVCVGSLIGICIGGKAIIDNVVGMFSTSKSKKESSSNIEEEEMFILHDEEEAISELSAASGSDGIVTNHIKQGKLPPKVRLGKELEKHVSGAHASDGIVTEHIINKRLNPRVRLIKEDGFGVTYDESETKIAEVKSKRKGRRKEFLNAERHIMDGTGGKPPIIFNTEKWQRGVKNRGVIESREPFRLILTSDTPLSAEPQANYSVVNDDFEVTDKIMSFLQKQMSDNKKATKKIIVDKVVGDVYKQIRIGAMGYDRDPNMVQLLTTHVNKMSCVIFNATRSISCNVLRLKGTMVLMPAHYLEEMPEEDDYYFITPTKVVRIICDFSRMALVSKLQDLIVWDLGNNVPPSADFTKYIMTAKDWEHYTNGSGALSLTRYDAKSMMQMVHSIESVERIQADTKMPSGTYNLFDSTHTILQGLRYRVHSMTGFCGAAIVRADAKMIRKICGMHVAGHVDKGIGYAEQLIYENIMKAVELLTSDESKILDGVNLDESPVELCDKQIETLEGGGNLTVRGVVSNSEIPSIPTKTTICKSLIHGLIGEIKTEPSILSSWDYRLGDKRSIWDPVLDAVTKYGVEIVPFPEEEIKLVEEHLSSVLNIMENSLRKREVNSLEIGINGIDQTDFWSPIEMKTSSGWPYCKRKPAGATGKAWMFEEIGSYESGRPIYRMKDEGILDSYEKMLSESKLGIPPCVVTMECPKDERRKLSKIYDKPATRTFTILPPEVNILFRQYFGDFAAMVMSNRGQSFCQVGINPETLEWSELMNSFLSKGTKGFAGDYAKFDGISPASIYHSIVNIVNNWYDDGEENARVRHSLLNAIVHRNGIAKELLLQYSQGMPSGFAMTVIFNSFVNYYFMALAWMKLVSASKFAPEAGLKSYDRYCRIIVYGDDNVVVVDNDFLDIYNLRTVASYLSEFGITYTDDAKNPIHLSEPFVDITTVSFLKRTFERVGTKVGGSGNLWKACLDKVSIEERCNWIRDCAEPEEALAQNVEGALYEASVWGEEYYNDLNRRLKEAYRRVMLTYPNHTYMDNQRRWWSSMTGGQPSQTSLHKLVKLSHLNQIDLGSKIKDVYLDCEKSLLTMLMEATPLREIHLKV